MERGKSFDELQAIIGRIEYREPGVSFRFCKLDDNGHYTLQFEVDETSHLAVDIQTGEAKGWRSGKALISQWMTENEIVRTAHQLVVRAYMHEIDERFRNMLKQFGGKGRLLAVVSDSYDFFDAVERWGTTLKADVEAMGGTLVIRPDSGDPTVIPVQAIDRLGDLFGYTVNTKGYKVLPPCVRVIQGDGIALDTITAILKNLEELGWSAENIAFGMGGALLQASQRDTMRWAMKCSAVLVNGEWRDVFKDPVTDHGKKSKAGLLGLVEECGIGAVSFRTRPLDDIRPDQDLLLPAYVNGDIVRTTTFEEVRARSNDLSPGVFERFVDAA